MDKTNAVSAWLFSGIFDLYVGFSLEEYHFNKQRVFFSTLGLEKILKSCIIYNRAIEYECLAYNKAKSKIEEIAKEYSHYYEKMIKNIKIQPGIRDELDKMLRKKYFVSTDEDGKEKFSVSGKKLIKFLEAIYQESRYPTAVPISNKFKVNKHYNIEPMGSSELIDFIYKICLTIIKHLKVKINLLAKMEKVENYLAPNDKWIRFKNIFFKETNGNIADFFS